MTKNKTQAGLLYLDANVWVAEIATFVLDLQRAGFISSDGPMLFEEILPLLQAFIVAKTKQPLSD